jgi:DNA-binding CsgD family transcriptional regulator/ArsR family metal-binding transcriptional regulator
MGVLNIGPESDIVGAQAGEFQSPNHPELILDKGMVCSEERFNLGYYDLVLCATGPRAKPGAKAEGATIASFNLDADVSPLFPYINAVVPRAELYREPYLIRFSLEGHYCLLHPDSGIVSPIENLSQATSFVKRLILFLKDLYHRKDEITPKHKICRRVSVVEILKLLPRTNCRECGFPACMAFAAALSVQETSPEQCPYIGSPVAEQAIYPVFDAQGHLRSTVTINVDSTQIGREGHPDIGAPEVVKIEAEDGSVPGELKEVEANSNLPAPLTARELEVLRRVAHGNTNTEISRQLNISPHTVKSHVVHIFNKLGVNDRTQAAVWAARQNIV